MRLMQNEDTRKRCELKIKSASRRVECSVDRISRGGGYIAAAVVVVMALIIDVEIGARGIFGRKG